MEPDLTVGSADPRLAEYLVQRFLIILPGLARQFQPPLLDASKWMFRKLQVWLVRGGHLELGYPGGHFRMFIPAAVAAELIRRLRAAPPLSRTLVHVADRWKSTDHWQKFGMVGDDIEMLACCTDLDTEGYVAALESGDRHELLTAYDAYQAAHPAPADPARSDASKLPVISE